MLTGPYDWVANLLQGHICLILQSCSNDILTAVNYSLWRIKMLNPRLQTRLLQSVRHLNID